MCMKKLQFLKNREVLKLFLTVLRTIWIIIRQKIFKILDTYIDSSRIYKDSAKGLRTITVRGEELDISGVPIREAEALWEMYRQHRFDLLGSGWVKSNFQCQAPGCEGYQYENSVIQAGADGRFLRQVMRRCSCRRAEQIYNKIDAEYEPIDWQKDFKSGYRWGADQWYRPQEVAKKPGGDIKVPWELSRLQHLPRLAVLSMVIPQERRIIYKEFRNQLLDFIAQNPVRMGVNHMCTMDVGIRTANIAFACLLWKGIGQDFDVEFEQIVTNYLFEECDFIRKNLEWSYYLTSNHYFADIAGLLWGSSVLPECRRQKKWLRFARNQLLREIEKQFHAEGSNAEGSTAYHRLTGEMAVYSVALIHRLANEGILPDATQDIYSILFRMGRFMDDLTRPDGMFTQIGDNDSGLFFRLSVTGRMTEEGELDECMNDGRTFVSAVAGMFCSKELENAGRLYPLEYSVLRNLCGNSVIHADKIRSKGLAETRDDTLKHKAEYVLHYDKLDVENLSRLDYPQFGIYLFCSERIYLCVNVTDNGQKGNAGHAHNDKLSFELFVDGTCIYEDAGTYLYTPFPDIRDRFRSTRYHNTIYCGEEQNRYNGLFSMYNDTRCLVTGLGSHWIEAQVEYRGIIHRRKIDIQKEGIWIIDQCNRKFEQQFVQHPVARGYGKMERC